MLKELVFLGLVAAALGYKVNEPPGSQLRVSLDKVDQQPKGVFGRLYNLVFKGKKNPQYEIAPIGEGLKFDGNYFLMADESHGVKKNCWTDFEQCDKGYTLSVWIKPKNPWPESKDEPEYIVSLGNGVEAPFGVKLAIRRRTIIPMSIGTQLWRKPECKIPDDYKPGTWMHIAVKQETPERDIRIFLDGIKMKCERSLERTPEATSQVKNQILIGADQNQKNGQYIGLYNGEVDDVQFFHRALGIPEIRAIYRKGKGRAKKLAEGKTL